MVRQQDRVKYGIVTIPYSIIKTGRIKTSEVIVDADTITVRVPLHKDKAEIQKIVLDKASWIIKKQKEYREMTPEVVKPSFKDSTTLPFLGRNYPLKINRNQSRDNIEISDGKFSVEVKSAKLSNNNLKRLYESWMAEKAPHIFKDKIGKYSEKLGVKVNRIVIKNLKKRWGSLTREGVINLNVNLLKAPETVIDYIILHELCHLRIKEHSHHYWDLVRRFMPSYLDNIEWLKTNGENLM